MAYINDNWLISKPKRNQGHLPVEVDTIAFEATGQWCKDHDVAVIVKFRRGQSGRYLPAYFTAPDIQQLVSSLLTHMGEKGRAELMQRLISDMSNASLARALEAGFVARADSRRAAKSEG